MKRKMQPVEIYVNDFGNIVIKQPSLGSDDHLVFITPAQVPAVVQWLQDCAGEVQTALKNNPNAFKDED